MTNCSENDGGSKSVRMIRVRNNREERIKPDSPGGGAAYISIMKLKKFHIN